ncbi:MAG: hypothetical protein JWQ55_3605, partial [Rhodopila sp.]|nr:hypothetical protein [Rhodopila sp.]
MCAGNWFGLQRRAELCDVVPSGTATQRTVA